MKYRGSISCDTLKIIAMITMLIDHIGAGILERMINNSRISLSDSLLRLIGRISFPIFCYLLLQGFVYTRSRAKYAKNLLIFAIISEIPFDYLFFGGLTLLHQNVFWTLLIGLLTLWGIELIEKSGLPVSFQLTGIIVTSAAGLLVAALLHTDYAWTGVAMILSFYFSRNNRALQCVTTFVIFFLALIAYYRPYFGTLAIALLYTINSQWPLLISFLLIYRCNGIRHMKKGKYLFYAFYPVHMILLWVALQLINYNLSVTTPIG